MSDLEKEVPEVEDEEQIIEMSDDEGNVYYYREEMVLPVDGKNFAFLVPLDDCGCDDEECSCHDAEEAEENEPDVFIARIDFDENGEPIYVDPTEEEFDAVKAAYEQIDEEQ